jgi:hypothetical protein
MTFGAGTTDIGNVIARMGMPDAESNRLVNDQRSRREFASMIGSVLDWIHGYPRLGSSNQPTFADENLAAADRHLRGAVETLLSERNRSRPASMILSSHALENVLKAFLAHHGGLDDRGARQLNHDLGKILAKTLRNPVSSELSVMEEPIKFYPDVINDRYKQVKYTDAQLWHVYRWAQFGAAAVARSVNPGLNISKTILDSYSSA